VSVAPPGTHAKRVGSVGRNNMLFYKIIVSVYFSVNYSFLFFIRGKKYFKSINSKWTSSQTLYIFNTLMLLFSVALLRDHFHFVLNLYMFLLFIPGTNNITLCFENSNTFLWVAAISVGRSSEGQQTKFNVRPWHANSATGHKFCFFLFVTLTF